MTPLQKYYRQANKSPYYKEKTFIGTEEEYLSLMINSSTVYINNIDDKMDESRIWELGLLFGDIKRIVMGLNRNFLTFCGFCFIEFYKTEDADKCKAWLNKIKIDRRQLSVDKDYGFKEGRQYGRGVFGGRMKDDNVKKRRYYVS